MTESNSKYRTAFTYIDFVALYAYLWTCRWLFWWIQIFKNLESNISFFII